MIVSFTGRRLRIFIVGERGFVREVFWFGGGIEGRELGLWDGLGFVFLRE